MTRKGTPQARVPIQRRPKSTDTCVSSRNTAVVQFGKHYVFANEARPTAVITDQALVHTVEGVELHKSNSFPSGHNTTAFTF